MSQENKMEVLVNSNKVEMLENISKHMRSAISIFRENAEAMRELHRLLENRSCSYGDDVITTYGTRLQEQFLTVTDQMEFLGKFVLAEVMMDIAKYQQLNPSIVIPRGAKSDLN